MTKVTILGEEQPKEKKKIEFVSIVMDNKEFEDIEKCRWGANPDDWDNIKLLVTGGEYDIMYAWDDGDALHGIVVLGHFDLGTV